MRILAVARFRLLTTIRLATPILVMAMLPPLIAAIVERTPQLQFLLEAEWRLGMNATAALLAWFFHAAALFFSGAAFGDRKALRPAETANASDLIDSAPIPRRARFFGEAAGIFEAMAIIHACSLPLLAVVAALSPLPTVLFVWMEAGIIAFMILGSAGAAYGQLAPSSKFGQTRSARAGFSFAILFFAAILTTTRETFGEAAFQFFSSPSMRAWAGVTSTMENPALLVFLLALLYCGYLVFFYLGSMRDAARA